MDGSRRHRCVGRRVLTSRWSGCCRYAEFLQTQTGLTAQLSSGFLQRGVSYCGHVGLLGRIDHAQLLAQRLAYFGRRLRLLEALHRDDGGRAQLDIHVTKGEMADEQGHQAEHEHQSERRHITDAATGKIFQGEKARAQEQRWQSVQYAPVEIEQHIEHVLQHAVYGTDHAVYRLTAGMAERALNRRAAVGAEQFIGQAQLFHHDPRCRRRDLRTRRRGRRP